LLKKLTYILILHDNKLTYLLIYNDVKLTYLLITANPLQRLVLLGEEILRREQGGGPDL
jgi:hypothetical protein